MAEPHENYASYGEAAQGAVRHLHYGRTPAGVWGTRRKEVVPAHGWRKYISTANLPKDDKGNSRVKGHCVGCGAIRLADSTTTTAIIRLDIDQRRGLHFNVTGWDERAGYADNTKFAAVFPFTNPELNQYPDSEDDATKARKNRLRDDEFMALIDGFDAKNVTSIWDAWSNGRKP
ncbi:unnamed protein product [Rhizoctonia solani]|uniref:Uncharacterized protein n=1 Tax=Rhizoctonia solani TaxID=456999 RepID=A0A8H3AVC4_9AGAM|nr:unnamed protein product [Rhizoctonia solani]